MLYIKIIGMQRDTIFAPASGIPTLRKNYLPTGGKSFNTHIQGKVKITGTFAGDFKHQYKGFYEADRVTNELSKSLKRDLIALKGLHAGRVRVIIGKGNRYYLMIAYLLFILSVPIRKSKIQYYH